MRRNDIPLPPPHWGGLQRWAEQRRFFDRGDCCGDDGLVVQLCFEGIPSGTRFRGNFVNDHQCSVTVGTDVEREWTWRRG